jgi:type I thyroxine 5'-deiodinase
MYRRYGDRARFLTIYIKEAHPEDEWQMTANEKEDVCYPQPKTLEQRVRIAKDFVRRFHYEIPLAVDRMDNRADQLYAGWPERFYIVDEQGAIAYKGKTGPFGYHPEEVEAWLAKRFPPSPSGRGPG